MSSDYIRWFRTDEDLPPDGVIVTTKISDDHGERNVQELKRHGNLWFIPDGLMYIYYTPTHWRYSWVDHLKRTTNPTTPKSSG